MRTALFTYGEPTPRWLGGGMDALRLAEALRELGAEVEVFSVIPANVMTARIERPAADDASYTRILAPVPPEQAVRNWPACAGARTFSAGFSQVVRPVLRKEFSRFAPSSLVVFGAIPWGTFALRTSAERGVPCATIEPLTPTLRALRPGDNASKFLGVCAHAMHAVFVPERTVQQSLARALDSDRVLLLRPGLEAPPPSLRETARPSRWRGRRLIITAGERADGAAQRRALEAFAQARLPETVLVYLGEPAESTRRRARQLSMGDSVEFAPCRDAGYIRQCLAWADAFVLAGAPRSGLGITPEALGVGTPVILTSDCPMAEDVEPGRHGWVVGAGDIAALVQALRHAATAPDLDAMRREARELIETRCAWRRSAHRLLRTFGHASREPALAMAA